MSSPRPARKPVSVKRTEKPTQKAGSGIEALSETTATAQALAKRIERDLADGHTDLLAPEALQELMAALCKSYTAQVESGAEFLPLRGRTSATSTDVMTTASGLLKSANLAVFELGMWQSWTGR